MLRKMEIVVVSRRDGAGWLAEVLQYPLARAWSKTSRNDAVEWAIRHAKRFFKAEIEQGTEPYAIRAEMQWQTAVIDVEDERLDPETRMSVQKQINTVRRVLSEDTAPAMERIDEALESISQIERTLALDKESKK